MSLHQEVSWGGFTVWVFFFLVWHIFSCFLIWGICIKANSGSGGNLNGQFESWESKMQGFFISKFLGIFEYEIITNITPVLCVLSAEKVPLGKAEKHVVLSCNTLPSNSTWDNVLFPKHKGKKEVPPVLPAILDFYNYICRHNLLPYPSLLWSTMHTWKSTFTPERGVRDVHFPLIKVGIRYRSLRLLCKQHREGVTVCRAEMESWQTGDTHVRRGRGSTACYHLKPGGKPQTISSWH